MQGQRSHYEILGVLTDASDDDVRVAYQDKAAVLAPDMVSGAPPKVIAAADQARAAIELANRTLTDPASRERYDIEIGIRKPGSGLMRLYEPTSDLEGHPDTPWHVPVPDIRGLFAGPARMLIMASERAQ
jgi:curved DNA-binding protein CbpA